LSSLASLPRLEDFPCTNTGSEPFSCTHAGLAFYSSSFINSDIRTVPREMENISRCPTFDDFVIILTEGSTQDITAARLQEYRLPCPPSIKSNVLRESLSKESKYSLPNTKEKEVAGNFCISLYVPLLILQWNSYGTTRSQTVKCEKRQKKVQRKVFFRKKKERKEEKCKGGPGIILKKSLEIKS
jgi:hypothetical protein